MFSPVVRDDIPKNPACDSARTSSRLGIRHRRVETSFRFAGLKDRRPLQEDGHTIECPLDSLLPFSRDYHTGQTYPPHIP